MSESYYLLEYEMTADYPQRRAEFRGEHLALAWAASDRGEMILGGPLKDGIGLMLFRSANSEVVETFARSDPYTINGLVAAWRVREWITTVGASALSPDNPRVE
jgi:uncharacterized protein YciI